MAQNYDIGDMSNLGFSGHPQKLYHNESYISRIKWAQIWQKCQYFRFFLSYPSFEFLPWLQILYKNIFIKPITHFHSLWRYLELFGTLEAEVFRFDLQFDHSFCCLWAILLDFISAIISMIKWDKRLLDGCFGKFK